MWKQTNISAEIKVSEMLPNLWPFTGRQGDCWPGRKKTNLLGPISRSPNGDNKKSKWKKDKLSENEFQLIKVKGTARNGGFNSIQPGASDSVQNGFAPPLEVIGGTDGCYMKQFQLDQFLDHLTVIKMFPPTGPDLQDFCRILRTSIERLLNLVSFIVSSQNRCYSRNYTLSVDSS